MNAASMNYAQPAAGRGLSVLSLQFEVVDSRPDWPVVRVPVDGRDPFAGVAPGWRGFDPPEILGPHSPLLPADRGRRVAVYCCSCGEPGCGVIAPVIVPSPDGHRVAWTDFRDYVGVFAGPVSAADRGEGRPWNLADMHFSREQYVAEVEQASRDRSWETQRRKTARLLYERLEPRGITLPPDFHLAWASPAWRGGGVAVMFESSAREPRRGFRQKLLLLTSALDDPEEAAADMERRLLATPADERVEAFGQHSPGPRGRSSIS